MVNGDAEVQVASAYHTEGMNSCGEVMLFYSISCVAEKGVCPTMRMAESKTEITEISFTSPREIFMLTLIFRINQNRISDDRRFDIR